MALLAAAAPARLAELAASLPALPEAQELRSPETGLALVRGRQGGDGAAFNLGEMTLTRCAVRLASGTVGHAFLAGRSHAHARLAALLDAMLQDDPTGPVRSLVLEPLAAEAEAARTQRLRRAAATRVDFFGLVRMG